MIQINPHVVGSDPVHDPIEMGEQTVIARVLVVERRQHQSVLGAQRVQKAKPFLHRQRVRLACGAEQQDPVTPVGQQPLGVGQRSGDVDRKVIIKCGQACSHHARDPVTHSGILPRIESRAH